MLHLTRRRTDTGLARQGPRALKSPQALAAYTTNDLCAWQASFKAASPAGGVSVAQDSPLSGTLPQGANSQVGGAFNRLVQYVSAARAAGQQVPANAPAGAAPPHSSKQHSSCWIHATLALQQCQSPAPCVAYWSWYMSASPSGKAGESQLALPYPSMHLWCLLPIVRGLG